MTFARVGVTRLGHDKTVNTPPLLSVMQVNDGALGVWPMQETSGTTAYDISGNGRNGTYNGGSINATPINSHGTGSYSDGYMVVPYGSWMNVSSWTCEVLVYPTSLSGFRAPMGRNASGTGILWLWETGRGNNYFYSSTGSVRRPNGTTGLSINAPALVAAKWDAPNNKTSIWKNGIKVAETDAAGGEGASTNALGIAVGAGQTDGTYIWAGSTSFAAYFGYALSDATLLQHAQVVGLA